MPPLPSSSRKRVVYLGIDPGNNGGLAFIDPNEEPNYLSSPMPETLEGVWAWFKYMKWQSEETNVLLLATIEKVSGWMGGKKKKDGSEATSQGQPGSTMFTFGQSYGSLLMALTAAEITYVEVHPRTWQAYLFPQKDREVEGKWKNYLRDQAKVLYPEIESLITLKTADALLLAHYGMMTRRGL